MATIGLIEALLGGLQSDDKRTFLEVFRALVPNLRVGAVDHQSKAENFQAYHVESTTAASTGEFSILHGLGRAPYLALPTLALDHVGAQIVPLEVTRVADATRIYLKSSSTSAVFSLLVE